MFKQYASQKNITFLITLMVAVGIFFFLPFEVFAEDRVAWPSRVIINAISWLILTIISIAGSITDAIASLLNLSIEHTVFNMGSYLTKGEGVSGNGMLGDIGAGIFYAWTMFRDVANMLFLFVILYISIATTLQMASGQTKKMLLNVVVAALLLNFSMFFSHLIIDVGNFTAYGFHEALTSEEDRSIATTIHQVLGLHHFYQPETGQDPEFDRWSQLFSLFILGVGAVITYAAAAFAFALASFMLLARFVLLIIYIIVSPLAFAAVALPQTRQHFDKWLKGISSQSVYAPLFLLFILAALGLLQGMNPEGKGLAEDLFSEEGLGFVADDVFMLILTFFLVCSLLIISTYLARQLSQWSGDSIAQLSGKLESWGGGKIKGAGRGVGRASKWSGGMAFKHIGGGLGNMAEKSMADKPIAHTWLGEKFRQYTTKGATEANIGGAGSFQQAQKDKKERVRKQQTAAEYKKTKQSMENYEEAKDEWNKLPNNASDQDREIAKQAMDKAERELQSRLQQASQTELENIGFDKLKQYAEILPKEVINKLDKSDEFTKEQIGQVLQDRQQALKDAVDSDDEERVQDIYNLMGDHDMSYIGETAQNTDLGKFLKPSQVDDLKKKLGSKSQKDKLSIDNRRRYKEVEAGDEMNKKVKEILNNKNEMSNIDKGAISDELSSPLIRKQLAENLTMAHLEQIKQNAKSEVQQEFREIIEEQIEADKHRNPDDRVIKDSVYNAVTQGTYRELFGPGSQQAQQEAQRGERAPDAPDQPLEAFDPNDRDATS